MGLRDRLRGRRADEPPAPLAVHVTMTNAATEAVLLEADLPPEELPASLAPGRQETTFHVDGADWLVEAAEPLTREAYVASGRLHLVVRRIEKARAASPASPGAPAAARFDRPTIEERTPPTEPGDTSSAYRLLDDDWRQREFVSDRYRAEIDAELADILAILADDDGPGFGRRHGRTRIPDPMTGVSLSSSAIRSALGGKSPSPLALGGAVVKGGFAYIGPGGAVYGREEAGRVVALAISPGARTGPLRALAAAHRLVLVDWIAAEVQG